VQGEQTGEKNRKIRKYLSPRRYLGVQDGATFVWNTVLMETLVMGR
jgi:hypothetical protein